MNTFLNSDKYHPKEKSAMPLSVARWVYGEWIKKAIGARNEGQVTEWFKERPNMGQAFEQEEKALLAYIEAMQMRLVHTIRNQVLAETEYHQKFLQQQITQFNPRKRFKVEFDGTPSDPSDPSTPSDFSATTDYEMHP